MNSRMVFLQSEMLPQHCIHWHIKVVLVSCVLSSIQDIVLLIICILHMTHN
jgi:hypothetical protein